MLTKRRQGDKQTVQEIIADVVSEFSSTKKENHR